MTTAPAGWYDDPQDPQRAKRYWDGAAWTAQAQPNAAFPPAGLLAPAAGPGPYTAGPGPAAGEPAPYGYGQPQQAGWYGQPGAGAPQFAPENPTFWRRNQISFITVAVCVAYVAIAYYANFVFIGILPILLTVRAFGRRERLAPLAALATVISVIVTIVVLIH